MFENPDRRTIASFAKKIDGKLVHLPASNFYPSPFETKLGVAPTVEHYFAAAKTLDNDMRRKILAAPTPGAAKRMGRHVELRPDWEEHKLVVMAEALRRKFDRPSSPFGLWLVATYPHHLVEGNTWGDKFWGVVTDAEGNRTGHNWLGMLLIMRRCELMAPAIDAAGDAYTDPLAGPHSFEDLLELAADLGIPPEQ